MKTKPGPNRIIIRKLVDKHARELEKVYGCKQTAWRRFVERTIAEQVLELNKLRPWMVKMFEEPLAKLVQDLTERKLKGSEGANR